MEPIIRFLVNKKSPLHLLQLRCQPASPDKIWLDYALFTASQETVSDPPRSYQNLFDAMLDAVHSALERSGGGSLEVVVSETGWPTGGGTTASLENARIYNNNLINHVNNGTPMRPGKEIEPFYLRCMMKMWKPTPPNVEKFWGLFHPNKQPKYDVNFGWAKPTCYRGIYYIYI